MIGCTADQQVPAAAFGDELAAGAWFATIDAGRPTQAMATMLRRLGEGEAVLCAQVGEERGQAWVIALVARMHRQLAERDELPAGKREDAQELYDLGDTVHGLLVNLKDPYLAARPSTSCKTPWVSITG